MTYQIILLANDPSHAPEVARRIYALWGHLIYEDTGMSASKFNQVIRDRAVTDRIPLTLIALAEGELVGTVSLKQHEDTTAPDLSPWIGGLLVDEGWRGKGLGAALLGVAERTAVTLGYAELYLSCEPDVEHFYARLGWELVLRKLSFGDEVALMRKSLIKTCDA